MDLLKERVGLAGLEARLRTVELALSRTDEGTRDLGGLLDEHSRLERHFEHLGVMEIPKERKAKEVGKMKKTAGCNPPAAVKGKAHKPAADHPWRRYPKRFDKQTAVNAESEFSNSLNAT